MFVLSPVQTLSSGIIRKCFSKVCVLCVCVPVAGLHTVLITMGHDSSTSDKTESVSMKRLKHKILIHKTKEKDLLHVILCPLIMSNSIILKEYNQLLCSEVIKKEGIIFDY